MTNAELQLVLEALVYSKPLAAHYPEPNARHEKAVKIVIDAINERGMIECPNEPE